MTKRTTGAATKAAPSREADMGQYLPLLAAAAARKRRRLATPLRWSEALAEAPWSTGMPPAWEDSFRRAYAETLVERGIALPAARAGASGKSGATKLGRYQVSQADDEHKEQAARAEAAGLSWAQWARRKLAER